MSTSNRVAAALVVGAVFGATTSVVTQWLQLHVATGQGVSIRAMPIRVGTLRATFNDLQAPPSALVQGPGRQLVSASQSGIFTPFVFAATGLTLVIAIIQLFKPAQRLAAQATGFQVAANYQMVGSYEAPSANEGAPMWGMCMAVGETEVQSKGMDIGADEEEEDMPTVDDLVAARAEFMRLQGKGDGTELARGEILRPVSFPGYSEPVDLVEMYQKFEELLGEGVKLPVVGSRVTGTVFDVDERGASVDFGGKNIGFCPVEELALCKVKHASEAAEVGHRRQFKILAPPPSRKKTEEFTLLSLKAIAEEVAWKRLQQYRENDVTFPIVVKGKNRGGYMVEVADLSISGFLPKSQATSDLATLPETADPILFMEQVLEVKVLDLDPERKRLVVSQRAANPKMVADAFKIGTVHDGVVQNVKPYGVFVDVSGMAGLLHISQISHNRIDNVETIFKVGDRIKCMVLSQDPVQGRLALSTKRLEPTHGDMLTNPQLVYEKAEEMAERFRADIAAAEKRMQEFEAKLAEQNAVAFG